MNRPILIAAITAFAAHSPALAETWAPVAKSAQFTLSLDKDSIQAASGRAKFWDKLSLLEPQKSPDFPEPFSEVRSQREADCASHAVASLGQRFYDAKGVLVHASDKSTPPTPVNVGSPADLEFKQVCN